MEAPGFAWRTEEACDIDFSHIPLHPLLQGEGEVPDRIQRPASRARAVAAIPTVLFIDGSAQLRAGQLHQLLCEGGNAPWPFLAVFFRHVTALHQLGSGAFPLQALRQCLKIGVQMLCIRLCRSLVSPAGCVLLQVVPAGQQPLGIQAPVPIPTSVSRVDACLVGYSPQGGWLMWFRSDYVRHQFPGRAPYSRHVLPHVVSFPHLRGLCVIRHPSGLRWAFPVTVLLHLPVAQESLGLATCFDVSLPACRGLWTPADLPLLAHADGLVLPSGA
jgi:hypothetical protein